MWWWPLLSISTEAADDADDEDDGTAVATVCFPTIRTDEGEVVELGRPNRGGLPGRAAYYAKSHVYAYVPTVLVPNV